MTVSKSKGLNVALGLMMLLSLTGQQAMAYVVYSTSFSQLPDGMVVAQLSGNLPPCEIPVFNPVANVYYNGIPGQFTVSLYNSNQYPSCPTLQNPVSWSQTVNIGMLADGNYSVVEPSTWGGVPPPSLYLGTFKINQGLLVTYEYVPVPLLDGSGRWLLGLIFASFALVGLSWRRQLSQEPLSNIFANGRVRT